MIKRLFKNAIGKMGYEITKSPPIPDVSFEKFESMCSAYERANATLFRSNPDRPRLLSRLRGTTPSQGYAIIKALAETECLVGEICEFGVAQGRTSALIASEISHTSKKLHLFDSFQGLPTPSDKDTLKDDIFGLGQMEAYAGTMREPIGKLIGELKAVSFPETRYVIHAGFIEQLIKVDKELPAAVSFAYIDFDLYAPIKIALTFLHDCLSPGGIMIVDDYNWFSTGAKTAVDEFIIDHPNNYDINISENYDHMATLRRL